MPPGASHTLIGKTRAGPVRGSRTVCLRRNLTPMRVLPAGGVAAELLSALLLTQRVSDRCPYQVGSCRTTYAIVAVDVAAGVHHCLPGSAACRGARRTAPRLAFSPPPAAGWPLSFAAAVVGWPGRWPSGS